MPTCPGKPVREALLSFPKRELSPLRRACLSLGLPVNARPRTNLARLLRGAGLGKTAIEYLKFSKGEQARQIVELYYSHLKLWSNNHPEQFRRPVRLPGEALKWDEKL